MDNLVWIVRVEVLAKEGLHQLQAIKVFESSSDANSYQDSINQNPIYTNINAFAFVEAGIFVESNS